MSRTIQWSKDDVVIDKGGVEPSIAMAGDVVVEVHRTEVEAQGRLYYRVGKVIGGRVEFGPSEKFDNEGFTPDVAINASGAVIVTCNNGTGMYYRVGELDLENRRIEFSDRHHYDSGLNPCVALDSRGVVVEVHHAPLGIPIDLAFGVPPREELWYHVGQLDLSAKKIDFGGSHKYDKGEEKPHVILAEDGQLVEVHKSQNDSGLWFNYGRVDVAKKKIELEQPNGDAVKYGKGRAPDIACDTRGNFVEVHRSHDNSDLWFHVGERNPQGGRQKIFWSESARISDAKGSRPRVAMNDSGLVLCFHEASDTRLRLRTGQLR